MRQAQHRKSIKRTGTTTIEMALVTPLMFLFIFAGMEFSRANMIRNVIDNAAFEGARQGIVPGAEAADCIAAAEEQLDIARINGYTVNVDPSMIDQTTTEVTVSVSIPLATNALPMSRFIGANTLTRQVTLQRALVNH
jgi:Flp pilus assembly protein TadG